jgi:hypothetical protein
VSGGYDDDTAATARPTFTPVTQRGRPLRPEFTDREHPGPGETAEPDPEPPPF